MTWENAVEELLCYGWIDGQAGKRDDEQLHRPDHAAPASQHVVAAQRRPRRAAGAAAPDARGRPSGRRGGEGRRPLGGGVRAPRDAEVPDDLLAAIAAEPEAQRMFDVLTKTNRFALYHRLNAVKRAETRERKIREFVAMLARHEAPYPQKARPE